jgi:hypothetical protein
VLNRGVTAPPEAALAHGVDHARLDAGRRAQHEHAVLRGPGHAADGTVAHGELFHDQLSVLVQLGHMPPPES